MFNTPRRSPKEAEESRLRSEANETFAPAKPGSFYEARREGLIEKYVAEGLEKFDLEQQKTSLNP